MPVDGKWLLRAVVLIAAVLIGTYVSGLDNPMLALDTGEVIDNHYIGSPGLAAKLFVADPGQAQGVAKRYSPLAGVSLAVDRALWGDGSRGFRITSLALLGLSALFLFLILLRFGIGGLWALLAALFFAVHPLHTQAINLISSRAHLLSGTLTLVAMLVFVAPLLRSADGSQIRRPRGSWVALVLFLGALLCGWEALAFVVFAGLAPWVLGAGYPHWRYYAGLGAIIVIYAALAIAAGGVGALVLGQGHWGAATIGKALALSVMSTGQMLFHPLDHIFWWSNGSGVAALVFVIVIPIVSVVVRKRGRTISLTLLFVSCAVAATFFTAVRGGALWESGLCLIVAALSTVLALLADFGARLRGGRAVAIVALIAFMGFGVARSTARGAVWGDPERVWLEVVEAHPMSVVAKEGLADVYRKSGRSEKAAALTPPGSGDTRSRALQLNNEGVAMRDKGRMTLAVEKFREAIDLWPEFRDAHFNLGVVYQTLGMRDSAAASLKRAVLADPFYTDARYNLGIVYAGLGEGERAEAEYKEAIRLDPRLAMAWANLGALMARRGDFGEAIQNLEKALEIEPGLLQARSNLALAYEQVDVEKAKEQWRAYLELARRRGVDPMRIQQIERRLSGL